MSTAFVWNKEDLIRCSSNDSPTIPNQIKSLDGIEIRNISSGQNHTLVCLKDGTVRRCVHDSQQCGSESIWSKLDGSHHVKGLPNKNVAIRVAAGSSHNVLLTQDHKVFTWGQNDKNQLGRTVGRNFKKNVPKLVKSLENYNVLQIASGNDHTLALTDGGLVFAWGSNSHGQLGNGNSTISQDNVPKVIPFLNGIPVMQIAAGGNHSFALSKSGTLYGWGKNDYGQLGLENPSDTYLPTKVKLITGKQIKYVCCGENHTACLTMDGCVYTFGSGSKFQLDQCGNKDACSPKIIKELSDSGVSQIACGSDHILAYVPKSGIIYVFAQGREGQFELSSTENNIIPVSLSHTFVLSDQDNLSYLSMKLCNQEAELRIKSIYAGGPQSFIITVPANTCDSDDFRIEDPTSQILTLSEEIIRNLITEDTLYEDDIGKIFSSPACLNGSFLLPNSEPFESENKNHGVDMMAVQGFFKGLANTPNLLLFINTKIKEELIPALPTSPLSNDALRLYLMVPECPLFDQPEFYSSNICQFAKSFLYQDNSVFDSWWPSNPKSFFEKLVQTYKQCVQYLLQLPYSENSPENDKRNDNLVISMEMLKKLFKVNRVNNMIDETTFIVPDLKDKVNVLDEYPLVSQGFYDSNIPATNLNFCNYPFLFDAETKSILLQTDAALQMEQLQLNMDIFKGMFYVQEPTEYCFPLSIKRHDLVNDTLNKLRQADKRLFKLPLSVTFEGEEAGGDGVRKEFFQLFFRKLMTDFSMFTTDDTSKLQWFNCSTEHGPEMFELIGILCGLVIYNSVAIDLHFPLAIYKKLLQKGVSDGEEIKEKHRSVTLDDLIELMPVVGRSLKSLLDYKGQDFEENFDLRFVWGLTTNVCIELCRGGCNQMVDQSNKTEYVDLCVNYLLNTSVETMFAAFRQGFQRICGGRLLDFFRPDELRSLVEGNEDYDFLKFERKTTYKGGYQVGNKTIFSFWKVFHEMDLANKKKFLWFVTGSDRIPITGMVDIQIQPLDQEGSSLPQALTCYNTLLLPRYKTEEELKTNLLTAIQFTEGFYRTQN